MNDGVGRGEETKHRQDDLCLSKNTGRSFSYGMDFPEKPVVKKKSLEISRYMPLRINPAREKLWILIRGYPVKKSSWNFPGDHPAVVLAGSGVLIA